MLESAVSEEVTAILLAHVFEEGGGGGKKKMEKEPPRTPEAAVIRKGIL
jgi:hypothetical protein